MADRTQATQLITKVLEQLHWPVWIRVVQEEPEFQVMGPLAERYSPGAFLSLMVVAGLNDYQLKGKAEVAYWPLLRHQLELEPVPSSLEELGRLLEPFYCKERMGIQKAHRVWRFIHSRTANKLWTISPTEAGRQVKVLWREIAVTMGQAPEAKTIAFSIKTLAIALLLLGDESFEFSGIPLPVDSRLLKLTPALDGEGVREFWDTVLAKLHQSEPRVTHLYLDSLLWQYAGASNPQTFLKQLGVANPERTVEAFNALLEL